ncbi:MAG: DUF4124 domain-containing protein [Gammaproteobacteria bacterium]|nr:DUF4124 domain-containing protein [Gammaproteobacteria bacterium]
MHSIHSLFVLLVLLLPLSVDAELYRWVDERGLIHFGDHPPVGGGEANDMPKPAHAGSPEGGINDPGREAKRRRLLNIYDEDRVKSREVAVDQEQDRQEQIANCSRAEQQLYRYERSRAMYDDRPDGSRRYLNETDRQAEIDKIRAYLSKWCDS